MPNKIPLVMTDDRTFNQYQQNINQALQPILAAAPNYGAQLTQINLVAGDNVVAHGLNRELQGWSPVRVRAATDLFDKYDTQDTSAYPKNKFIVINSSAAAVVDFWVY